MTFRWEIDVVEYNTYGDKILTRTPMSILAEDKAEVTDKVRCAFGATFDSFRKFWSHDWALKSVAEERAGDTAKQNEKIMTPM